MKLTDFSGEDVLHHEARHIYRVLGGGVGRGVAEIQLGEIEGGHSRPDGGGQHVDTLTLGLSHRFAHV